MKLPRYPAHNPTGLRWLGDAPNHWAVNRIRFMATLNPSKSEIAALDRDMEVSFLPMDAIGNDGGLSLERTRPISEVESGYTYLRDGDVAIAKITPCFENGKGALMKGLVNGIGFGTTELIVARSRPEKLDAEFLSWLFRSPNFRSEGEGSMYGAGGQKRVPDDFLRDFAWAFPPLTEQSTISAFLDRETAKIASLIAEQERLLELLAEKRQAVISHAVTKGLNPEAPMKDSGVAWLGDVPAHWDVLQLRRSIATFEQGWSPDCEARPAEDMEWGVLKAGCVNGGVFVESENKALPQALTPRPELGIKVGDLLMSRASGSPKLIGSVAVVENLSSRLMLSDKIFRLNVTSDVEPRYLAMVMGSSPLRQQIEQSIGGAEGLASNLPQSRIKEFWLAVPPNAEQLEILRFVDTEGYRLSALAAEAKRATALLLERRSALIAAAVTGQIDVREVA